VKQNGTKNMLGETDQQIKNPSLYKKNETFAFAFGRWGPSGLSFVLFGHRRQPCFPA
jgi:hypothetical protein